MASVEKKAKSELLSTLKAAVEKPEEFTKYVKQHMSGGAEYELDKATMALKTLKEVADVSDLLTKLLDALMPQHLLENDEMDDGNGETDKENGQSGSAETFATALKKPGVISALGCLVVVTRLLVDDGERVAPENLWRLVCRLHDSILAMGAVNANLQSQIVQLCETWYLQERDGAAYVAPQTLTWLIQSVLEKDKPATDIKRLLRFKASLRDMDIMHPSSEPLRRQLKRCIAHSYLLTNNDGKKLLQFLFELDVAFIPEIHNCIKGVLPYQKRFQVEAFAEIYYKAWKSSSGHFKITIEEVCLQDYVTSALHLRNTMALKQVNFIIKFLVDQKANNRDVEGLLESLYGGVLWRSLHAANPVVRENAVHQLALVFPLIRADQPQREIDEALSTSFQRLTDCLTDPHPNVRKGAILAAGRILTFYWELLPMHTTQVILELFYESLAFDKTATSVREAVFRATLAITENPLSHATLKTFLPKLRPLLNDASERVRSQFAVLLNTVKKLKAVKFYEIVPADQILRALGAEPSEKIRSQLALLLENTFFPWSRKTVNELLERSLTMLLAADATDADRRGAVAFFMSLNLAEVPPTIPVKFIGKLFTKVVIPWLEMTKASKKGKDKANTIKKQKVFEFEVSVEDHDVIVGLMNIINTIWGAIHSAIQKEDHINSLEYLQATFDDNSLVSLDEYLPQCDAVYAIAARMPSDKVPNFSARVLEKTSSKEFASSTAMTLQCLFSWDADYRNKIMTMLADWISRPLQSSATKATKKSQKKGNNAKKATKQKETEESAETQELSEEDVSNFKSALSMLNSIVVGAADWIRDELLLSEQFDPIVDALVAYKHLVTGVVTKTLSVPSLMTSQDLVQALSTGYRLLIHRAGLDIRLAPSKRVVQQQQQQNRIEADDDAKTSALRAKSHTLLSDALNWVESTLISDEFPQFEENEDVSATDDLEAPSKSQDITLRISEKIFVLVTDFVALGLPQSSELIEALVACAEKLMRVKLNDNQFMQAVSATSWKLALFHLAIVHSESDESSQVSLISYDRLAALLFQALQRDNSEEHRISTFGLRAILLQSQWSDANPYKQIFLQRLWNALSVPADEEFDAATSRVAQSELPRDARLILSAVQISSILIKEVCSYAKDIMATSTDTTLDIWRAIEFSNMMMEEESEDTIVQRKLTKQASSPLLALLSNIVTRMRDDDEDESALKRRAVELVQTINSNSAGKPTANK